MLEAGALHLNLTAIAQKRERVPISPNSYHERQVGDLLNPVREDRETLNRLRRELGGRNFSTQYLQDPIPPEGNIVRMDWFDRYDEQPPRHKMLKVIQSWDTAMTAEPTSAFSVCTTWGFYRSKWYLLEVERMRLEFPDLKRAVIRSWRKWRPDRVVIETASSGTALGAKLRSERVFRPILWDVASSKEDRLIAQTGQLEARLVILPHEAPWLDEFCRELLSAPNGKYWDQVDSMTQFLEFSLSKRAWINTEFDRSNGRKLHNRNNRYPLFRY